MLVVVETMASLEVALAGEVDGIVVRCRPEVDVAALAAAARGRCAISLLLEAAPDGASVSQVHDATEVFVSPATPASASGALGRRIALLAEAAAVDDGSMDDLAAAGFAGAVIGGHAARRLLAVTTTAALQRQVNRARLQGLVLGFGGLLEAPDVPRLLALAPDFLLVDAVAWRAEDERSLTPDRLRILRDLIPRAKAQSPAEFPLGHDRIFVRDWTVPVRIGAYRHEREAQRVRFSVDAEVGQRAAQTGDLRDVVSYDLILDAIGRATAAHVELVEALAEDVARAVLAHPRVITVDITVEKLDLGPGSVGCRLRRTRERPR